MADLGKLQWSLCVNVYHGPSFGHYIEKTTHLRGTEPYVHQGLGSWKGLGIPESVLRTASALIVADFEEHMITRYGCQGELPTRWAGEVEPF